MSTLTLKILDDRDEEFVMTILGALTQKQIIEVVAQDPFLIPGTSINDDQLSVRVNKSKNTRSLSVDEIKTRFGLL